MPTPLRDDDPVHVLPEDEEDVAVPTTSRIITSVTLPLLKNTVATTVTGSLVTDDRDGPDYSKAD